MEGTERTRFLAYPVSEIEDAKYSYIFGGYIIYDLLMIILFILARLISNKPPR